MIVGVAVERVILTVWFWDDVHEVSTRARIRIFLWVGNKSKFSETVLLVKLKNSMMFSLYKNELKSVPDADWVIEL